MTKLRVELGDEPIELSNCPFCGSDNVYIIHKMSRANYHKIECGQCLAKGPVSVNIEFAISGWNGRS